jgi:hypothetical protein
VNPVTGCLYFLGKTFSYDTTGRQSQFPVLVFDYTANPYSPEEILDLSHSRNIRWLIIKRRVQLDRDPVEQKEHLLNLLKRDFKLVKTLEDYDIYQKR